MTSQATRAYTPTAKVLHWTIVLLVTIQFVTALAMPDIGPHTQPDTWISLHFSIGVLILAIMAARLVHRLMYPVPLEASQAPAWERFVALLTHRLFYLILLVGPLLGWASASAHRLTVSLFGLITLPSIAAPKARWALTAGDVHASTMWILLALIGLHAAAALYHHVVRHDSTLKRMLPAK
ncbi:cytochrome b [Telluria sp. Tellsp104]